MSRTTLSATLAFACSLATSAGADSIIRITDDFWSVNGRPIQRIGNLVLWDKGSAFITPLGAFGRNFDTIPGVIPVTPTACSGARAPATATAAATAAGSAACPRSSR
jgi:hypothetical protein